MSKKINILIDKIDDLINVIGDLASNDKRRNTTPKSEDEKKYEQIEQSYEKIEEDFEKHTKTLEEIVKTRHEKEKELYEKLGKDVAELEKKQLKELENIHKKKLDEDLKHYKDIHKRWLEANADELELLDASFNEEYELVKDNEEAKIELIEIYSKKQTDILKKNFKEGWSSFTGGFSQLYNLAKKVETDIIDSYGKADQEAANYGRAIGLNRNEVEKLRNSLADLMADESLGSKFNMATDEMLKSMTSYTKQIGRAVGFTSQQIKNLAALNMIMGEDKAIKFASSFEKFGLNIDHAAKFAEEMFGDASKKGLSFEQISENFLNNIELAQQYTFENGIEGLKRMAENATAVKWNMQQTAAFAEKVNSVEGAIKTGAQLSVLGGPFAQFSNPMGMLYESLNDMEGLQDRIFAMFGNLGEWSNEKGMLEISTFNKQRIRAAASAMGLNYGDVINNVNQQARRKQIQNDIKGLGLDKDTQELVTNTGQLDEQGRTYVVIGNEKKYIKDGLTNNDKEILRTKTKTNDENLQTIAINSKSLLELQQSVEKERKNQLTQAIIDTGVNKTMENIYETLAELQKYIIIIQAATLAIQAMQAAAKVYGGVAQMINNRRGLAPAMGWSSTARGGYMPSGGGAVYAQNTTASGGIVRSYANGTTRQYSAKTVARYNRMYGNKGINVNAAKVTGAATMGIGIVGGIGSSAMSAQSERLREKGLHNDADNVNLGAGAAGGITSGAMLGSAFGLPGMILGGIFGGVYGLFSAADENKKLREQRKKEKEEEERQKQINEIKENIYNEHGFWLKGDYTLDELRLIRRGKSSYGSYLYQTIIEKGDEDIIDQIPAKSFANGGVLNGPSHANGGMNVINNQTGEVVAEVQGGEGIVPENIMKKFSSINNLIDSAMKPLQPMGEILHINSGSNSVNSSLNVGGSASVNVGGSIQLSLPGGQTHDIINDPSTMKMIGDNVMKHIMLANQQIFNKSEFYRKW